MFVAFKPKFADPKPLRDRDNYDSGREVFGGYGGGYRDRHERDYDRGRDRDRHSVYLLLSVTHFCSLLASVSYPFAKCVSDIKRMIASQYKF